MTSKKPILITGSHRSGSTWVGKMLSAAPSVAYICEPFNVDHPLSPGICSVRFNYWFTHVTRENESSYYKPIKHTINLEYDLFSALKAIKSKKDIKCLREYGRFLKYRMQGSRTIIKDPIALFSAEWLAERFNMDVVVLIRHPAAFVSSIKKANWLHPFSHFLEQPLLLKTYLFPFEEEIKKYAYQQDDLIGQAILLWKLIHYIILQYQEKHKNWIFIRHEELSRDPLHSFHKVFAQLGLEFSEHVEEVIKEHCGSNNSRDQQELVGKNSLKRNSELNISNWKHRLTPAEIDRVRCEVEDISKLFYSDQDWL